MKKRILGLVIPVLLVLTLSAQAAESRILKNIPSLSFNGSTAICTVTCTGNNTKDKVSATLTLYQGGVYVDSWSDSGTGMVFISESCEVESGKSYKLVLTYSINGIAKPSQSDSKTCP